MLRQDETIFVEPFTFTERRKTLSTQHFSERIGRVNRTVHNDVSDMNALRPVLALSDCITSVDHP